MAKLKVEVINDIWDEEGDRIAAGTVIDMDAGMAAKFIKSGNVELLVPDETAPKRGRPPGPSAPPVPPPDPGEVD